MEKHELLIQNGALTQSFTKEWGDLENQIKELEAKQEEIRQMILETMLVENIVRLENESGWVIDLYPESKTEQLDTARLKKEQPELCDLYKKEVSKKAYVKIWKRKESMK